MGEIKLVKQIEKALYSAHCSILTESIFKLLFYLPLVPYYHSKYHISQYFLIIYFYHKPLFNFLHDILDIKTELQTQHI